MLSFALGLVALVLFTLMAGARDPIGLGLLLSSRVDGVAEARIGEPVLGLPPLYVLGSAVAGASVVGGLPEAAPVVRWVAGVLVASFLLLTLWDMRRRRGTLAVYIRLRRAEIGFEPQGDVIEVPKLVFLVMNQPTPFVWLATAVALGLTGIMVYPVESWPGMVPLAVLSASLAWLWFRNRTSPWEPLARRLRWLSLRSGERLIEPLHHALDLDPEVLLVREAADAVVARFMSGDR
jgi:hypothetical protein